MFIGLTKRKFFRKHKIHKTYKKRGGGGAASKSKTAPTPTPVAPVASAPAAPAAPRKRVVLFDLDGTLLFRTEVFGQWDLQYRRERKGLAIPGEPNTVTAEKVKPRPDFFFPEHSEFVYVRPGALEALNIAQVAVGEENVHLFTASSNPKYVLDATGIAAKVNKIFTREWTESFFDQTGKYAPRGHGVALKDFAAIRKTLELSPSDIIFLFDDHPEWVKNTTENDHAIPIPVFQPAYELYGVSKTHNVVPDTIPHETTLPEIVTKILRDEL